MTYEQAIFFRILLSLGYCERLNKFLNEALEEQEPISNIVLELAFVGGDKNKILSLLNAHTAGNEHEIDYTQVFSMLLEFFGEMRKQGAEIKEITALMYRAALLHPDIWEAEKEWRAMYLFDDYIEFESTEGANAMLDAFLERGELPQFSLQATKQTLSQRIWAKIRRLFD